MVLGVRRSAPLTPMLLSSGPGYCRGQASRATRGHKPHLRAIKPSTRSILSLPPATKSSTKLQTIEVHLDRHKFKPRNSIPYRPSASKSRAKERANTRPKVENPRVGIRQRRHQQDQDTVFHSSSKVTYFTSWMQQLLSRSQRTSRRIRYRAGWI